MSLRDNTEGYGGLSKFLHWWLLLLVIIQYVLAVMMDMYPDKSAAKGTVIHTHEAFGLLVLAFAVVFLLWRLSNPKPSLATLPDWQRRLARTTHWAIYLLILLQPLSGIATVIGSGHSVQFFGIFSFGGGAGSDTWKAIGETLHGIFPILLLIALGLHVAGALYHQYVSKDSVLRRMLPGQR